MNENQLETFLAVRKCGSYSRAAEELFLSQPTVSYRVQTLEEELGVRLFSHANGQTTLTAAGEAFVSEAKQICECMQAARRKVMRYSPARVLTIGFPEMMLQGPCGTFMRVMQMIPDGAEKLASCKVGRPPEDVQQLLRGEVDMIFTDLGQPELDDRRFGKRKLFNDMAHVCLRRDHPLAGEKELTRR